MRKIYLIFSLILLSSPAFSQDIIGKWNFEFILPDTITLGENLKPISEKDFMQINDNESFHYKISEANLIANGSWELNEDLLSFHYTLPAKTTRTYHITKDNNSLILNENGVNYAFVRSEIEPAIISTYSITLNSIFRVEIWRLLRERWNRFYC